MYRFTNWFWFLLACEQRVLSVLIFSREFGSFFFSFSRPAFGQEPAIQLMFWASASFILFQRSGSKSVYSWRYTRLFKGKRSRCQSWWDGTDPFHSIATYVQLDGARCTRSSLYIVHLRSGQMDIVSMMAKSSQSSAHGKWPHEHTELVSSHKNMYREHPGNCYWYLASPPQLANGMSQSPVWPTNLDKNFDCTARTGAVLQKA